MVKSPEVASSCLWNYLKNLENFCLKMFPPFSWLKLLSTTILDEEHFHGSTKMFYKVRNPGCWLGCTRIFRVFMMSLLCFLGSFSLFNFLIKYKPLLQLEILYSEKFLYRMSFCISFFYIILLGSQFSQRAIPTECSCFNHHWLTVGMILMRWCSVLIVLHKRLEIVPNSSICVKSAQRTLLWSRSECHSDTLSSFPGGCHVHFSKEWLLSGHFCNSLIGA